MKVKVKDFINNLYKDAENKGLLDRCVGTFSISCDNKGNEVSIVIFENDDYKEETRINSYYKIFEEDDLC